MKYFEVKTGIWRWKRIENYAQKSLKKFKSIKWGQIWNNFQIATMPGFRGQRNGAMTSVEIKNGIFGFVWLFWPNSLDQPQFQPPNWLLDEKTLRFVFVSILMTMSYMSLEIFSFEWIQILNGTKVWQYHRLSHHKIWATSIHIWFFEFHTNLYARIILSL